MEAFVNQMGIIGYHDDIMAQSDPIFIITF